MSSSRYETQLQHGLRLYLDVFEGEAGSFADLCRQQPNATSITIHNLNATGKPIVLVAFLCMVTTIIHRQLVLFAALPFSFIHGPFFSPFQSQIPTSLPQHFGNYFFKSILFGAHLHHGEQKHGLNLMTSLYIPNSC